MIRFPGIICLVASPNETLRCPLPMWREICSSESVCNSRTARAELQSTFASQLSCNLLISAVHQSYALQDCSLLFHETVRRIMGQSMSNNSSLTELKLHWLLRFQDSYIKYASCSSIEKIDAGSEQTILALAYQASESEGECSPGQNIRYQISKDGGETWSLSRVVAWGLCPCWAPVLFYDKGMPIGSASHFEPP